MYGPCFMAFVSTGLSSPSVFSDFGSVCDDAVVQRMVAVFDYDPWESSPNIDSEVSTDFMSVKPTTFQPKIKKKKRKTCFKCVSLQDELGFRAGDIIYVLGEMDQDGFYYVCGITC